MPKKKENKSEFDILNSKLDLVISSQEQFQMLVVNKFAKVDEQFAKVDEHFKRVWEEVGEMRTDIKDIKMDIRMIRTELTILDKRLAAVEERVDVKSELKSEVVDLREKVNMLFSILKKNGIEIA